MKKWAIVYIISTIAFGAALIALGIYLRLPVLINSVKAAFSNFPVVESTLFSSLYSLFLIYIFVAGAYYLYSGIEKAFSARKHGLTVFYNRLYYLQFFNSLPLLSVFVIDLFTIGIALDNPQTVIPVALIVFAAVFTITCMTLSISTARTYSQLNQALNTKNQTE